MPNATWGDPEPRADEAYPLSPLKHLLQQMMTQFAANGACIALFDESINKMVVRLHVRTRGTSPSSTQNSPSAEKRSLLGRRTTIDLNARRPMQQPEKLGIVAIQDGDLFPVGAAYAMKQDLIGMGWYSNEAHIMRHADYISTFPPSRSTYALGDVTPSWYLVAPIQEPTFIDDVQGKKQLPSIVGVVVLYQTAPAVGFQQQQCLEALNFTERMALYLQNDQLRRSQERTTDYMKRLQQISTAFPSSVRLGNLVEDAYRFATGVVDVSSMLLTLYDRDTDRIYDVFAVCDGTRVEGLPAQPVAPEERPQWWRLVQEEQRSLLLNSTDAEHEGKYDELLLGIWGDQRKAQSFLLLPMKMFTRVIGSLSLTSRYIDAYRPEEILVLETMVQIITVSIENAKLYDKSRESLRKMKQREEELAAMNSALQAVSLVLDTSELLHNLVEFAAKLVQAEMSTFFQLSADGKELIAQAVYAPGGQWKDWTEASKFSEDKTQHKDLIEMIRLPFKDSVLERQVGESFFYLDQAAMEEVAQVSKEGGIILLRETGIKQMLMIPVRYQTNLQGILALHMLGHNRVFTPKEAGVLLAICSQAASAIRNAQLFEEIQETNAELQRMDKLKDEFIVTASHELRTPLSAVKGYASLLQRQYARTNPQQVLRFITKIAEATQQLSDLVVSMTDAAHLGMLDKKLDLQIGPAPVLTAAKLARDMLSANIEQEITLAIAPDLWVNCDPLRLRQVMTNLLDNAVKYSPPEGRIAVDASATTLFQLQLPEDQIDPEQGDRAVVLVRVHDTGEGILEEDQRKIFDKFVRAPRSLTTPVRGTGLGLYICRRYMEAMHGKLWLERSVPGEGSTFSFYLPRIDAPAEIGEEHESA